MQLERRGDDWFCPFRCVLKIARVAYLSALHVEHELGLGDFPGRGIGVRAVVVDAQCCEVGHQLDEVKPAVIEAPVDMLGGDVVAAAAHASLNSLDVPLRTGKADVPDIDSDALRRGLCEHARDRVGAQRGFEGEVLALGDRPLQEFHAPVPCRAVGVGLSQSRVSRHQCVRGFVGIVIIGAGCSESRAAYAALACAIDPGKNVDTRLAGKNHGVRA